MNSNGKNVARRKVFVSFDFDHDRPLKQTVIRQMKEQVDDAAVIDNSLKEPSKTKNWEKKAENRIRHSDRVVVILGVESWKRRSVRREVEIAWENGVPVAQVVGYSDRKCRSVAKAGKRYRWKMENLKKIVAR